MKKLLVLTVILALSLPVFASTDWRGPAYTTPGTQDWFTASNWSAGVPDVALMGTQAGARTYGSNCYDSSLTTCPIIANGAATTMELRVAGDNAGTPAIAKTAYLIMQSGSLATQNYLMVGGDSGTGGGRSGTVVMHGGNMILGGASNGVRTTGHLFIGHGTGTYTGIIGTLIMDGGVIDAGGDFAIGKNYSQGYVYLSGDATIIANSLKMRPDNAAAVAYMDLTGNSKVVINGDITSSIATYISNGWLTGNGNDYEIMYDYNVTTPGKTTIFVPEPTTICLLGFGLFGLIRRK
jgi:hypothetical protein